MAKNIKTAQKTSKKIGTKVSKVTEVKKRDGTVVPFDESKITNAVLKAMKAVAEGGEKEATKVAAAVTTLISNTKKEQGKDYLPTVEEIQDLVEKELILQKYSSTAKAYILYREKRAEIRKQKGEVPREVKNLVTESKKYFRNQLSEFVYYTTYSRWIPEKGRRETWMETVDRYVNFMRDNLGGKLTKKEYDEIRHNMLSMRAMGSMRLLWAAGKAAAATHVCAYNCSYIAPTDWRDFGEIMYVLMCGTGCGYSVEHQNVEQLPIIQRQTGEKLKTHVIKDSKEGWADAFVLGLRTWAAGKDIAFDYSEIRPQGARLKTMGGRASGPEPLRNLIDFSRAKMLTRQGRRLTTLDVHDIICKTGEVVVMGGVRRSALISLSDLDDQEMKEAKNGQFYISHPERMMANNSVVYNEKPTIAEFLDEWLNLIKAQSGERGTFNRGSLEKQLPARRWPIFKKDAQYSGLNPCGEIVLKSKQFCNLSEVVARREDTLADLADKVRVATILGTYQSTLTKFGYLSPEWRKNCEEERLLGVSITGQWDCPALRNPEAMKKLQKVAVETNKKYAKRFGIAQSTAVTCVKPSGNGSQLFDSSSGCHPRHAKYYIRRVRIERHNPIFLMLKDMGVPYHPEVGQTDANANTYVLEFPVKAPEGAVVKKDITAMDQLEYWKMLKENYTEHNPSVTVSVGEDEWLRVGNWLYENWDLVGGLSFLPRNDYVYKLAPYEEITKERYEMMAKDFPEIDFSKIVLYEYDDVTTGSKELACAGGTCEIDPLAGGLSTVDTKEEKK
ncbi:MAG TPA: ATP cone domain-containing protein [Candidatus Paceibacterota bacterium]|jgi:ribonucleoside-diphosphate reductase alpha chain|nr:ATP cone domain-containing protein [Candidatus Paceibacterota bacterium]HOH11358.1 ATP cone domain-containing protein [Candidatus Paceibacterota bacterium]HPB60408.1 ATP cone domain-containing protein [Candidatus Paceibacterota bacterium]HPN89534.1 ATP cone domain-containing protein [Candidatus Paceibacterota bacterium]HPV33291.1 ATP cone domain-containing protein [Candidatus Paceibacterota bacterium]